MHAKPTRLSGPAGQGRAGGKGGRAQKLCVQEAGRPSSQPAPQGAFLARLAGAPADSLSLGATAAGVNT